MAIRVEKLPIFPQLKRFPRSPYMILNIVRWLSYLLRLFSPGAWLMAFFQKRYGSSYYSNPTASESYQLAATVYPLAVIVFETTLFHLPRCCTWLCVALAVECVQYQLWNVIVRPAFDPNYKRYSTSRTLMIVLLQYFQMIFVFTLLYKNLFGMQFHISPKADLLSTLSPLQAIEFSAGTMTTLGYGSIYATPGSTAAIAAACEALCGVFFLGLMLATVVSGIREVKEVSNQV